VVYTTIKVTKHTRERLAKLTEHLHGTYDELLSVLIDLVPSKDDEGEYTDEFRASLLRGLPNIRHGQVHSSEDVRKRLGISP
jgi:hypothetical protein